MERKRAGGTEWKWERMVWDGMAWNVAMTAGKTLAHFFPS